MTQEVRLPDLNVGALSPDGNFYWDGVQWMAAISADGAWRWDGATWVPFVQSRIASYLSARTLGVWVSVLLGVCIAVAFIQLLVVDPYYRIWLGLGDQYVAYTIDVAALFALWITSAFFVVWFRRAYRNAAALGAKGLQFSSAWAVGWWFVPVACFWMPYRATVDIWSANNPVAPAVTSAQARQPDGAHTLVSVWWVTWLLSLVLANGAAVLVNPDNGLNLLSLGSNAVTATAAVLAILVVVSVSKRQDARWRQRASMTPSDVEAPSEVGQ